MINNKKKECLLVLVLLFIGCVLGQSDNSVNGTINSIVVTRPRSMSVDFWTSERMRAAKEPKMNIPTMNMPMNRSLPIANGPPVIVSSSGPVSTSPISRMINANGRHVFTSGRVFWSCSSTGLSSCSASVIPSDNHDLIVTAGHCVFDTNTLRWLINCNWIFVPAYSNGNAPYGRWPAREVGALTAWTRGNPDYNYDVAFVALSTVNGRHIEQVTGSQSLGFNMARYQTTYSFGYPVNIGNGETLQSCSGTPVASLYTYNGYRGQGISNCAMGGGCSGGPWLQKFNTNTGVGTVYSVNSFTYSLARNTIHGPVFDSNTQLIWTYMRAR